MPYLLAKSLGDLDAYLEAHSPERKVISLDTEYTTLDLTKAKLTGFSISLKPETAIYIPVGHRLGEENLDLRGAVDRIHRKIEDEQLITTYFVAKGDRTMLLKEAGWAPARFRDVAEARYLWNCERKSGNTLKELAKELLGFDMARFESLFTPTERKAKYLDISSKPAWKCADYACADADATLRLDAHWDEIWTKYERAVAIDMAVSDIIACMEYEGGLELNIAYIDKHETELTHRMLALEAVIHRTVGRTFDINSPSQLAPILFDEMKIQHPFPPKKQKGKSGQWVTNADALEKIAEQHPIGELVISYRKVYKAVNTYLKRLRYLADHQLAPRFTLNQYRATTFRLSAPGGNPKEDGKTGLNAQAIGKGENRKLFAVDLSAEGSSRDFIDDLSEEEILVDLDEEFGYSGDETSKIVTLSDEDHADLLRPLPYIVETAREDADGKPFTGLACFRDHCASCPALCELRGIDVTRRVVKDCRVIPSMRRAFKAPDGYSLVSLDYDWQEIVIAANLSGEPAWINALLATDEALRDVHAATAREAFVHTFVDWEELPKHQRTFERETGKRLNFGTLFGATAETLARKMGIPLSKAEQIWEDYRRGLPVLFQWIANVIATAQAKGFTQTYLLGRVRPLIQFYKARGPEARRLAAYADRCAVNTWIQGTGADATRIAMARIRKRLEAHQVDRDQCRFGLQIHDELMYIVLNSELSRLLPILKDGMEFKVKPWKVQLATGAKVGAVWGQQEAWKFN